MKVAVIGTGSWGTALAKVLVENKHETWIWGRDQSVVDDINIEQRNAKYLPGILLPTELKASTDLRAVILAAEMIVLVVPTQAIRQLGKEIAAILGEHNHRAIIVHAAKGLEMGSHLRLSQVIEEEISPDNRLGVVVLSGPSHAEEVAKKDLTTITAASDNLATAKLVQEAFMSPYFRVYTNNDVIGVEMGGALKNIIAVCAGMLAGLNYGDNAKAALITRGLAEITRLGVGMGADPLTFSGLSGVGDLIVTCTSIHSRNWRAGKLLAEGYSVAEVNAQISMAIEGLRTCPVANDIARALGVDMPITQMLARLLAGEEITIQKGIDDLMRREGKQEASLNEG